MQAIYNFTLTDVNGCTQTRSANIISVNTATVIAAADITITKGTWVSLNAYIFGLTPYSYIWTPSASLSCSTCFSPVASPTTTTTYILTVTDANGCKASDSVVVTVVTPCGNDVFLPNAFSPNVDGENEELCVYTSDPENCIASYVFKIYNRWGQIVFTGDNITDCWNGSAALTTSGLLKEDNLDHAVFAYVLEVQFSNGEILSKKGNISLVR